MQRPNVILYDNYNDPYEVENLLETNRCDQALMEKLRNILQETMRAVGDTWLSSKRSGSRDNRRIEKRSALIHRPFVFT